MSHEPLFHTANCTNYSLLQQFAKEHRKNSTEAESVLWQMLKGKDIGTKFRRQHIIGDYIADFVALKYKLIIELDGGYHNRPDQQLSDEQRTNHLNAHGYKVIRFSNEEVLHNTDTVIQSIIDAINECNQ